jgi:hypothetical protein
LNGLTIGHADGAFINGVVVTAPPVSPKAPAPPAPAPNSHRTPATPTSDGNGTHAPEAPPKVAPVPQVLGKTISLPLAPVVAALPVDLQARVAKKGFADYTVAVPLDAVLSQLSCGVVKIPFGIIRASVPQFFGPAADADQTMVTLPLGEILRQVKPAQLAKPTNQVRIAADDDVTSPFADKGNDARLEVQSSAPKRKLAPDPTPTVPTRQSLDEIPKPAAPTANVTPALRLNVPATPPTAPKPPTAAPAPRAPKPTPNAPIPMPKAPVPTPTPASKSPAAPSAPIPMAKAQPTTPIPPAPAAAPAPVTPPTPKINGVAPLRMTGSPEPATAPAPVPAPAPAAPVTPPASLTKSTAGQPTLSVALNLVMEGWPAAL